MMSHTSHGSVTDKAHGLAHVMQVRILAAVWIALVILTVATVAVTKVDMGSMNLWVAMAIATVKASLVALYFMHLRYDRPINGIILIAALLFVTLFVGIALTDTGAYNPDIIPGYAPGMQTP